jgi:WD40 repeat protein/tetratricopeptide (TPR) repeat protein
MPPGSPHADRNLLFGILAVQMDFLTPDGLVAGLNAWVLAKHRPLSDLLVEQGKLTAGRAQLLDALVNEHLDVHHHDAAASLAALPVADWLHRAMRPLGDSDLDASLSRIGSGSTGPQSTIPPGDPRAAVPIEPPASRFVTLRPHAKGGLGEVFVALDLELDREVALKEIQAEHADDGASRGRFLLEAEITGGLEHPGVVPVYGLGTSADGRPYYAMRFIRGRDLRQAIAEFHAGKASTLEFRDLLDRFVSVCQTVAYAHSRGVVHRDLKPANVMLGAYGETLVVDWGLAKVVGRPDQSVAEGTLRPRSSADSATQAGTVLGTPAFMSPEQAGGLPEVVGPAADVYSLGATLYQILTGKPPFSGNLAEILDRVRRGEFARPRQVHPAAPRALEAVCLKAMAVAPGDRYPTALALAEDVKRWLADEPVSAWREPWTTRLARWGRRHKPLAAATAALLVAALAALAAGNLLLARAKRDVDDALVKAQEAEETAREEKDKVLENLYVRNIGLADRHLRENNLAEADRLLASCPQELRGWEWRCLQRQLHGGSLFTWRWSGLPSASFNRDGRLIAVAVTGLKQDNELAVYETATGKLLWRVQRGRPPKEILSFWRPDGRAVALWHEGGAASGTLEMLDGATGKPLFQVEGVRRAFHFSPDGRLLWAATDAPVVSIRDAATGRELAAVAGEAAWFSADGKRFIVRGKDGALSSHDTQTGQKLGDLPKGAVVAVDREHGRLIVRTGASWSSTLAIHDIASGCSSLIAARRATDLHVASGRLLLRHADATLTAYDLNDGREMYRAADVAVQMAWTDDGRALAAVSQSDPRMVRVFDGASGKPLRLLLAPDRVRRIQLSPDGRSLAAVWGGEEVFSSEGRRDTGLGSSALPFNATGSRVPQAASVWDVPTGRQRCELRGSAAGIDSIHFSADGERILTASQFEGAVRLWDLTPRWRGATVLTDLPEPVISHAVGPDGDLLAAATWQVDITGDRILGQFHLDIATIQLKGHLQFWSLRRGRRRRDVPRVGLGAIGSVAFSPDGERLAAIEHPNTARKKTDTLLVVHPANGAVNQIDCPEGKVVRLAYLADGRLRGLSVLREQPSLRERLLDSLGDPAKKKRPVKGSVKAQWLLEWDREGKRLLRREPVPVGSRMTPDGKYLTRAHPDGAVILDADTLRETASLPATDSAVVCVALSGDGRRAATAHADHTIRLWNWPEGRELAVLRGHSKAIDQVLFSPDGERLASVSLGDRSVRLWGVASPGPLLHLPYHSRAEGATDQRSAQIWSSHNELEYHGVEVAPLSFSPDGRHLVLAHPDEKAVWVWDGGAAAPWSPPDVSAVLERFQQQATKRLERNLAAMTRQKELEKQLRLEQKAGQIDRVAATVGRLLALVEELKDQLPNTGELPFTLDKLLLDWQMAEERKAKPAPERPRAEAQPLDAPARRIAAIRLGLWEKLIKEHPEEPQFRASWAEVLLTEALAQQESGQKARSTALLRQAESLLADLPAELQDTPGSVLSAFLVSYCRIAVIARALDQDDLADRAGRRVIVLGDTLLRDRSRVAWRSTGALAHTYHKLAELEQARRPEKAVEWWRRAYALNLRRAELDLDHGDHRHEAALAMLEAGVLYQNQLSRPTEAENAYRQAAELWQKLADEQPTKQSHRSLLSLVHNNLGKLYHLHLHDPVRAEAACRRALRLRETLTSEAPLIPISWVMTADTLDRLRLIYADTKQPDREEAMLKRLVSVQWLLRKMQPGNAERRRQLAAVLDRLGDFYSEQGGKARAVAPYQEGVDVLEKLVARYPREAGYRITLVEREVKLGVLLNELGRPQEASPVYRSALARWRQLASEDPGKEKYPDEARRRASASVANRLGGVCRTLKQAAEAELFFRQSLDSWQKLADEHPANRTYRENVGVLYDNLGRLYHYDTADIVKAERSYRRALRAREQLAEEQPLETRYREQTASTLDNLAKVYDRLKQPARAHSTLERYVAFLWALRKMHPNQPDRHHSLAAALKRLGDHAWRQGDKVRSEELHRQGVEVLEKLADRLPREPRHRAALSGAQMALGELLLQQARPSEAEDAFRTAIDLLARLAAEHPTEANHRVRLAECQDRLGQALAGSGKCKEACAVYREALRVQEKLIGDFPTVAGYRLGLGGLLIDLGNAERDGGQREAALKTYEQALHTLQPIFDHNPKNGRARFLLRNVAWDRAAALYALERHESAIKDWTRAIELDDGSKRPRLRIYRAMSRIRIGQVGAALAEVEVVADGKVDGGLLYDAACVYGMAAGQVKDAKRQDECTTRAVVLLRRAAEAGYFREPNKLPHLKKDSDFDAIRAKAAFRAFVAELESNKPQAKESSR